jgi:hypothetical protein
MLVALLLSGNYTGFGGSITPPPDPGTGGGGGGWGKFSGEILRRRKYRDDLSASIQQALDPAPDVVVPAEVPARVDRPALRAERPVIDPTAVAGIENAFNDLQGSVIRLTKQARKRQDDDAVAMILLMQ